MFLRSLSLLTILILADSCANEPIEPPLVDGDYQDYVRLGVNPISLADSVDLYIYQDEHFVWICYTYPSGSYGTMDMSIESPNLNSALNLHISAQLGEWYVNQPETAPDNPQSDKWWNMKGWIANEIWPNGLDRVGEVVQPQF